MDDKTCWFCLQHKDNQDTPCWNALYITHRPEDHDTVMAFRRAQQDRQTTTTPATRAESGNPGATSGDNKMVISQKLNEELCSRLMVSDSDADNICNELCGQGKY